MRHLTSEKTTHPVLIFWIIAGWVGYCVLPWYGVEGFWEFAWLADGWPLDHDYAPAAVLIAMGQKLWLTPMLLALAAPLLVLGRPKTDPLYARVLVLSGAFGFSWLVAQGLGIGLRGFSADWLQLREPFDAAARDGAAPRLALDARLAAWRPPAGNSGRCGA